MSKQSDLVSVAQGDPLYIDTTNDRVGVGTTSPSSVGGTSLVVHHASAPRIRMTSDATGQAGTDGVELTVNGSDLVIENRESTANTRFYNGGAERMRIDSSGNLLVGTTSSEGRITIRGDSCGGYIGSITNQNGSNCNPAHGLIFRAGINTSASGSNFFSFRRPDDTVLGSITQSGASSVSYNTSSDYRLKENVVTLTGAADRLAQIPVHRFNFIEEPYKTVDGFIAHEVQEFVPEAVTGYKDGTRIEEYEVTPAVYDEEGNLVSEAVMGEREVPDYQGIDQSKLVPLLTAALQEALQKIDALEARVAALEAN